jgi:hypothetical protein
MRLKLDENIGRRGLDLLCAAGHESAGVVIFDTGPRVSQQVLLDRMHDFLATVATHPVTGKLWIVEPGRGRMYLGDKDE